jgi:hypothetical protein
MADQNAYRDRILRSRMKNAKEQLEANAAWRRAHPEWPTRPSDEALKALKKKKL